MNRNNFKCIFNGPDDEDQIHSFTTCLPILSRVINAYSVSYQNKFGTLQDQKLTIKVFIQIEKTKNHVKNIIPYLVGKHARTLAQLDLFLMVQQIS